MRTIKFLLEKEFRQIFRNKSILALIIGMPVIQLLILPLAANYEVKNINISVIDHDRSGFSNELITDITSSGYFRLVSYDQVFKQSMQMIEKDKADLVLEIPSHFEKNLVREGNGQLFIAVNAINGTKAGLGASYLSTIIRNYSQEVRTKISADDISPMIDIRNANWYNPLLNYRLFMVPGILAILVTMVGGFLSALNIVREKETGTIEQINVTPVKKHHFILGKLIPFWILGNVVFTIGLLVSWLRYGIVPEGNILLLYAFVAVYLLAVLGFGLLISTICDTQQQAMFIMFFFVMIFILMGGLFTPVDSMPGWAKIISGFNPLSYLIDVMRLVILKGSGLDDILHHLAIIAIFATVLNIAATMNYSKKS